MTEYYCTWKIYDPENDTCKENDKPCEKHNCPNGAYGVMPEPEEN